MNSFRNLGRLVFPAVLMSLLLGGCGGSSSSPEALQPQDPGMGQVALLFTDLPSEDFDQILIRFDEVSLLGDEGHQVIYPQSADDGVMEIDLLSLRQVSDVAFIREVPAGMYSKVRLHLTGIDLVKINELTQEVVTEEVVLVANGKLDLNPRGEFEVRGGQMLFIELDIDANRSFQAHQSGNGRWHFRPVVFMDIFGDYDTRRLMRVFGEVTAVDSDAMTFDLCPIGMISQMGAGMGMPAEHSQCITVDPGESGVFGPVDGTDLRFEALEVTEPAQQLTMIGYFRSTMGMEADAMSEFDAVVIELGDQAAFARLGGMAVGGPVDYDTEPGTQVFEWAVRSGQSLPEGTVVTAQIQSKTRIFDSEGNEFVDGTAIQQGVTGMVDGIDDAGLFRSSLVVLDALNAGDEQLSG
ncbi:MAG: DUF4382 domain-containing protein, partial [Chromatiales bacterium]|nr:DUF4382 domain-containing protein [Chromatiales bacterium]